MADDAYDSETRRLVEHLATGPTNSYAATKHALFATDDFAEGVAAFREKRPARFSGRPALVPAGSSRQ